MPSNNTAWHKTLLAIKQAAFPRRVALERELSAVRAEHQAVSAELESVRNELAAVRSQDAQQFAELQAQLAVIEADRSSAEKQVQLLESSLQAAARRQEATETRVKFLESKLDEERKQYEYSLNVTGEALNQLQLEQCNLNTRQSVQSKTFDEVSTKLLQSLQSESTGSGRPVLQMAAIAGLLFLLGALLVIVTLRDSGEVDRELAGVTQGVRELQANMERHFDNQQQLLDKLTAILDRENTRTVVPDTAPAGDEAGRSKGKPAAPGPGTDTVVGPMREPGQPMAHDRWGPPLLLEASRSAGMAGERVFDPDLREAQHDLLALGFNLGEAQADGIRDVQTEQALEEFELLYLPLAGLGGAPSGDQLGSVIKYFADLAREDARKFNIDSGVLAAIRLSTLRTGVDFSFLMELAATESSFNPVSTAATSSAAGLYQFRNETWLDVIRIHGDKYGIGSYASQVEHVVSSSGKMRPVIRDPEVNQHVLKLRYNPRIAALLAAEYVKRNMKRLVRTLGRVPDRTDIYLTHFFGASGALSFLKTLEENPDKIARDIFPGAAKRNRSIFDTRQSKPRTVAEIYELFSRKFNTSRYEDRAPG